MAGEVNAPLSPLALAVLLAGFHLEPELEPAPEGTRDALICPGWHSDCPDSD